MTQEEAPDKTISTEPVVTVTPEPAPVVKAERKDVLALIR